MKNRYIVLIKIIIHLACLIPLAWLGYNGYNDNLGANPIEVITRSTGFWTLALLMVTLSVTPLRQITGLQWLIRLRRMIGLYAFFYACLHFTTYIWLDQFFDLESISKDIVKRPFITAGFTGFVLLIPLALTSTKGMVRRLTGKRWQQLHRLIYLSAIAGVVHFFWLVKADISQPLIFGTILALLLGHRATVKLWSMLSSRFSFKNYESSNRAGTEVVKK